MSDHTRSQKMAQEAFQQIQAHGAGSDEYRSFARSFPSLVHQCGLAQAVAFALARATHLERYIDDLAAVLTRAGHTGLANGQALARQSRDSEVENYVRLSRDAIAAAVWMKRYVEAMFGAEDNQTGGGE